MKYFNYTLLMLFALLAIPIVAMMSGYIMEKLLMANLLFQAIAIFMCGYGLTMQENKLRILYVWYLVLILTFYSIAIVVAGAPIPDRFG